MRCASGSEFMTDHRLRLLHGTDDDVSAIAARLDGTGIRVVLPEGQPAWSHQLVGLTLTDLLSRLFPRISVVVADDAVADAKLPPGPDRLKDRFMAARNRGGLPVNDADDPAILIRVGGTEGDASFFVDGDGWESYVGTVPSRLTLSTDSNVPTGPIAAACRTAALVFDQVFRSGVRQAPESVYSSLKTYEVSGKPLGHQDAVAVGLDAMQVGAGSIGGAAIYSLARVPGVKGQLVVIDPQDLEAHNHVRALLVSQTDSAAQRPKLDLVGEALGHHDGLDVVPHKASVTDYHASLPQDHVFPIVLSAVDSAPSRRAIQDCLPLVVVNAACHPHEVTVSGHVTGQGPCVCCLHMKDILDAKKVRMRMLAGATGMNEPMVAELLTAGAPLNLAHLRGIAKHRELGEADLNHFEGKTLDDLWREELLYGAAAISTDSGSAVAVAAPFVTALAGTFLASELLKRSDSNLRDNALGPNGSFLRYVENPYASPLFADRSSPPRWEGSECICRSTRRMRILTQRYGL